MKKSFIACLGLALMFALAACAKKTEKTTAAGAPVEPAKAENAVVMAGEYMCPDFNMTIAAGWVASLETDGKVDVLPIDEKGPGLHFAFENGTGTAEEAVAAVIAAEKGSAMGTATINDVEFKTTTYSRRGMTHAVYAAFRNGVKITITAAGKDGKIERDLKAMLSTVQFR